LLTDFLCKIDDLSPRPTRPHCERGDLHYFIELLAIAEAVELQPRGNIVMIDIVGEMDSVFEKKKIQNGGGDASPKTGQGWWKR